MLTIPLSIGSIDAVKVKDKEVTAKKETHGKKKENMQ